VKHYAFRADIGRSVLIEIECDGCGTTIKPTPEISKSGWCIYGFDKGPETDKFTFDYCPMCVPDHFCAEDGEREND
jgi:hypothetical protein